MLIATEESKEIEGGGEKRQIENPEKVFVCCKIVIHLAMPLFTFAREFL